MAINNDVSFLLESNNTILAIKLNAEQPQSEGLLL